MNNTIHSLSAGAVAFLVAFVLISFGLSHYILFWAYVGLAYFSSVLPDALEPATSWQHRKKWHSERCLMYMLIALIIGWVIGMFTGYFFLMFFALGYVVHLLEDATTPVGLPKI